MHRVGTLRYLFIMPEENLQPTLKRVIHLKTSMKLSYMEQNNPLLLNLVFLAKRFVIGNIEMLKEIGRYGTPAYNKQAI